MAITRIGRSIVVGSISFLFTAGCSSMIPQYQGGPTTTPAAPASTAQLGANPTPVVATAGGDTTGPLTVSLTEFKVAPGQTTVSPGQVAISIRNDGQVQHELLVFRSQLDPSQYPQENGDIKEDGQGVTKVSDGDNLDPGTTQSRIVNLTAPGKYLFVCNLPGHFKAGMYAAVTVGAPATTPAVTLSEFKVDTASSVKAGKYTYVIVNGGKLQHELLVFRTTLAPSAFPLDGQGEIQENGPGITKVSDGDNIDPANGQTRTIDLSQPGTYVFVCNLPGHFKAGMYSVAQVS
jgi:uncharacterized cupredoxin-like copper-binding protein